MTTPLKKSKAPAKATPAPDPKLLLAKLHKRLEIEQAHLNDWHRRLLRTFHTYERRYRLVAHLAKRIAKLENA